MTPAAPVALLVPSAGLGTRMGSRKTFLHLGGRPLLFHTLGRFAPFRDRLCQTIVVLHPDDLEAARDAWEPTLRDVYGVTDIVPGGARRQDSVRAGLARVSAEAGLVAIHDAVRPFVAARAIAASLDAAEAVGAAIVAAPMKPTVKRVVDGRIVGTIERGGLWGAQTPQVFRRRLILEAFEAAERDGVEATDDAQLVERIGGAVAVVEGSDINLKVTTPEDLKLAEAILANRMWEEPS